MRLRGLAGLWMVLWLALPEVGFAFLPPPPQDTPRTEELRLKPPTWEVFQGINEPSWLSRSSKTTPLPSGRIQFTNYAKGKLTGSILLEQLEPNRSYILSIERKPGQPGSDKLLEQFKKEGRIDLQHIKTDEKGSYKGEFALELPPGDYDVRLLVRDELSWEVVLYNDFWVFTIK